MESIGERVKYLRKEILNMTQKDFGIKIGLKPNSVSDIESGKNNPTNQTIKAICREFNVYEDWLQNGQGDMRKKLTRNQEIQKFSNDVMAESDDSFKKRFFTALSKLNESDWATLSKIVDELNKEG